MILISIGSVAIAQKNMEGTAYLQLGSIAFKKGDKKSAYSNMRKAVELGLPDKETEATAFLQLPFDFLPTSNVVIGGKKREYKL